MQKTNLIEIYYLVTISVVLTIINAALLAGHINNSKVHMNLATSIPIVTNSIQIKSSARLIVNGASEYINLPIRNDVSQSHVLKNGTVVKIQPE